MILSKSLNSHKLLKLKTYNLPKIKNQNSFFKNYLIGFRNQFNIADTEKILLQWFKVRNLINSIWATNGKILIIHTNTKFKTVLNKLANKTTQIYCNHWHSGLLTNHHHTRWVYRKENKLFFGKKPKLIILIDCNAGTQVLNEARIKNIPVVGFLAESMVKTNPDYPILSSVSKTVTVYFYYNLFLKLFRQLSFSKLSNLTIFEKHTLKQLKKKKKIFLRNKKIKLRRKNWYAKKKKINLNNKYQKNYNSKKQFFRKKNNDSKK